MQGGGLEVLERRVKQDLGWLDLPMETWTSRQDRNGVPVKDAVVIGGGMTGLAVSAALRLAGVTNIVVYDKSPKGLEGPWSTYARMPTLRTAKNATGPALGIASLTYRAWYEAQFGADAWTKLDKAPRQSWMDYLIWYRRILDLPVENNVEVSRLLPQNDATILLKIKRSGQQESVLTRHVVLATGFDGFGGPNLPPFIAGIDRKFWAHTSDDIDFTSLKGKHVGVVGFGASALDNACTALEAGARQVDVFIRRKEIPAIQKFGGIRGSGLTYGFAGLPDEWKWRFLAYEHETQNPAPRQSLLRMASFDNARLFSATPVVSVAEEAGALSIVTPTETHRLDYLILATGFCNDPTRRPELADIAPHILLWRDRYPEAAYADLARSPYLGRGFVFQEKDAGSCPVLRRIHCLTHASTLSRGKLATGVPNLSEAALQTMKSIVQDLFVEDRESHYRSLQNHQVREFSEAELEKLLVRPEANDLATLRANAMNCSANDSRSDS